VRVGRTAHLGHGVLVAQEHHVEAVDLALDEVPLVDPAEPLHEDPLDVEPDPAVEAAGDIDETLLEELAKMLIGQPSVLRKYRVATL